MAITMFDSADAYNNIDQFTGKYPSILVASTLALESGQGKDGGAAFSGPMVFDKTLGGVLKFGIRMKTPASGSFIILQDGHTSSPTATSLSGKIVVGSSGTLYVYGENYNGRFTRTTVSGVRIPHDTWIYIEIATSQTGWKMWWSGKEIFNIADDMQYYTSSIYGHYPVINPESVFVYDTIVLEESTYSSFSGSPLPLQVAVLEPVLDTAQADFTGTVADVTTIKTIGATPPYNYIASSTVGHKSEFTLEDLTIQTSNVLAVAVHMEAAAENAPASVLATYVVLGGIQQYIHDYVAGNVTPIGYVSLNTGNNPSTGLPYVVADINSMLVGFEIKV